MPLLRDIGQDPCTRGRRLHHSAFPSDQPQEATAPDPTQHQLWVLRSFLNKALCSPMLPCACLPASSSSSNNNKHLLGQKVSRSLLHSHTHAHGNSSPSPTFNNFTPKPKPKPKTILSSSLPLQPLQPISFPLTFRYSIDFKLLLL